MVVEKKKTWRRFSKTNALGNVYKFRIEDHDDVDYNVISKLVENHFVKEETIHIATDLPKSNEALQEMNEYLQMSYNLEPLNIVVCRSEESEQIVAVSVMYLSRRDEDGICFKSTTKQMRKLLDVFARMYSQYDVFEKLDVDCYYDDRCVVVHPDYRGLGIAQELFHARRLICKEHNVPVTGAWMTSLGSQIAAKRDGWETVYETEFNKIGVDENVIFKNAPEKFKFMIAYKLI